MFAFALNRLHAYTAHTELNRHTHVSFVMIRSCGAAYRLLVAITKITCVYCTQISRAVVYKHASLVTKKHACMFKVYIELDRICGLSPLANQFVLCLLQNQ